VFFYSLVILCNDQLYVGNLPFTATDEAVRALFSKHGTVEKVSLITDRDTGSPARFGFVEMSKMPTHPVPCRPLTAPTSTAAPSK